MSDDQHRGGSGFGAAFVVLIFVGVVAKFWIWILVILGVIVAGVGLGVLLYRCDTKRIARARVVAAIAARADEQHAQIMVGDDRGIYGMFPPAKPPPAPEPLPRVGENWDDYLAETRKRALAT